MRSPAGPSARTVWGILRRGMALVVPAAPGTIASSAAVIEPAIMLPQPDPTTNWAFSSKVMALRTSSILSLFSFGCACKFKKQQTATAAKRILFILINNYLQVTINYIGGPIAETTESLSSSLNSMKEGSSSVHGVQGPASVPLGLPVAAKLVQQVIICSARL